MPKLTQGELTQLGTSFETQSPDQLLRWAYDAFGSRVAVLSAMQKAGSVVCHMVSQLQLPIPVVFVDTGVNFQETLDTRDRMASQYGLKVITLTPEQTMEDQTKELGILYLTPEGQQRCCHFRKTMPLLKARGQFDCLIGSLRRSEGGRRDRVPILSVDPEMNCVRLNVIANMPNEDLASYIDEHQVIINPLHAQGYTTIGCNRCTTPVLPEEPPRAGRWRHLGQWSQYCGINPTDRDGGTSKSIDLPRDVIDRILLGPKGDFMI